MLDDSDNNLLSWYLMALSALTALLAILIHRRNPAWLGKDIFSWRVKSDIEWTGKGFESGNVTDRIAQVRRDFIGALHSRPHPRLHSRARLSAASLLVRASSYWQHASSSESSEERPDLGSS